MDTAEEVDDNGTWGRVFDRALGKEQIGQKDTKPRAGIGLKQEVDRTSGFLDLGYSQGRKIP